MVKKTPGSENIRVVVRCRDLLPYEAERGDKPLVRLDLATNQVVVNHLIGDPDVFAFDAVYNNTFTQRDIFLQEVRPLADAVLQGYNATVFAYGQSGSGKTHTMTGKLSQRETWGMMPQIVDYLFAEIKKLTSQTRSFKVRVSYVELYNGKSRDLLASKQVNLEIKQNMAKNFYVKGAEMPEVTGFDEAIRWFNAGTERRQTASTDLNDTSSRSHSLFTVQIEQFDFENDPSSPIVMMSKVNVVDLAGSEKLSKTNATGDTAKEGCNINLSLSALATVIDTIVKGAKHIPYRGSPLTMLLKDSLGGNSKTVMFANVGPSDKNTSETISTLRFALRAKQIENKPIKNVDPKDARIQDLLDQIEQLKARLGNVDLNVEDDLRQRIEELEIENSDLRGGGEKGALELEERCRGLQAAVEEHARAASDAQRELQRETERRTLLEVNYTNEQQRGDELRSFVSNFIKRVCSDEEMARMREQMPADGSYNRGDANWHDKEIVFYLQAFAESYEQWKRSAYTQADMERYAKRAVAEVQQQAQQQLSDAVRARDEVARQRDDEAARRVAEMEATSQLKVDLAALRDENDKLRAKVQRDQEKIKAKLRKHADEARALQDQIEAGRAALLEKERDVERLKRMLEEGNLQASRLLNASLSGAALVGTLTAASSSAAVAAAGGAGEGGAAGVTANAVDAAGGVSPSTALLRQLEEERKARRTLEGKVREANVSLRRYGVCIVDSGNNGGGNVGDADAAAAAAVSSHDAFMLAAAEEKDVDGDALAQLQQQLRIKQRLAELAQQQQRRLDDMLRKYELLKTGTITTMATTTTSGGSGGNSVANDPLSAPLVPGVAGALDEATAMQIRELLQRKDDELERVRREKDETCDKLVRRLNKGERKQKELESALEEERAQAAEERSEAAKEAEALRAHDQQLAVELETLRGQLDAAREQVERVERAKESEVEYLKGQVEALQSQLSTMRSRIAEADELQQSYERLQHHAARGEMALAQRSEALENSRQMLKWSNALLEQEKRKTEDLEATLRQRELEQRRREEAWKAELAEQMNLQAVTNNRRLEEQAAQFEEQLAEEQARQRALQKKVKSAKNSASKVAQRYDEMILENEALTSKFEELKVTTMKMYLEKQEAQRDLEAFRPTSMMRARDL